MLKCHFYEFLFSNITGDNGQNSEFDDFVTASQPPPASNSNTNSQNGTPKDNNGSNHFFDDFSSAQPQIAEEKKTMSKDSIMALFNQKPSNPVAPPAVNPLQQFGMPNLPNNMGGMQIPANFGMNAPQNIQPQQPLVGGPGFGGGNNMMNNPFLAMSQPTSDPNNVSF